MQINDIIEERVWQEYRDNNIGNNISNNMGQ